MWSGLFSRLLGLLLEALSPIRTRLAEERRRRQWNHLRALGMKLGSDVLLPESLWIDMSHCFLISIGDHCGFGEGCAILAHDAQMDEYLDAARLGRVVIHESCHIGMRTVILPGVEIGPRTIVGANSVVASSLPPDTVCAGNPAKVICSLDAYLEKHRKRLEASPKFEYMEYRIGDITPDGKAEMQEALKDRDGYMIGGRSAELKGVGGTMRT